MREAKTASTEGARVLALNSWKAHRSYDVVKVFGQWHKLYQVKMQNLISDLANSRERVTDQRSQAIFWFDLQRIVLQFELKRK